MQVQIHKWQTHNNNNKYQKRQTHTPIYARRITATQSATAQIHSFHGHTPAYTFTQLTQHLYRDTTSHTHDTNQYTMHSHSHRCTRTTVAQEKRKRRRRRRHRQDKTLTIEKTIQYIHKHHAMHSHSHRRTQRHNNKTPVSLDRRCVQR